MRVLRPLLWTGLALVTATLTGAPATAQTPPKNAFIYLYCNKTISGSNGEVLTFLSDSDVKTKTTKTTSELVNSCKSKQPSTVSFLRTDIQNGKIRNYISYPSTTKLTIPSQTAFYFPITGATINCTCDLRAQ